MVSSVNRSAFEGIENDKKEFEIKVNGKNVLAYQGETVAATLIASGIKCFGETKSNRPRGLYCGIGHCYECRVTIDNIPNVLGCQTEVTPGCDVDLLKDK